MNDAEHNLRRLTPRRAPVDLRARVLGGVSHELQSQHARRSDRFLLSLTVAVAASVVLLICWSRHDGANRLTRALGPRPVPSSIGEIVTAVAQSIGNERAEQLGQRLRSMIGRGSARKLDERRYRELLDDVNSRG